MFIPNPYEKSKSSAGKFESLSDSLNGQAKRKGLQYPIDLGLKDQQNFLLFTVYDSNPQSFKSSETSNQRQSSGTFDSNACTIAANGSEKIFGSTETEWPAGASASLFKLESSRSQRTKSTRTRAGTSAAAAGSAK